MKYNNIKKGNRIINMDSQAPNVAVKEFLENNNFFKSNKKATLIKPEVLYGDSRFDFYVEQGNRKIFIEVKGVTLEEDGVTLFPDAPSQRAVKHVNGLVDALGNGFEAYVFFVIQMEKVKYFTPNYKTHPEFALALKEAEKAGVNILAYDCKVTEDSISINKPVEINLE